MTTHYSKDKYDALDEDDKTAIDDMLEVAINALHNDSGAVVMIVDVSGAGQAMLMAAGNQLLIEPLLRSAGAVCNNFFDNRTGMMQ